MTQVAETHHVEHVEVAVAVGVPSEQHTSNHNMPPDFEQNDPYAHLSNLMEDVRTKGNPESYWQLAAAYRPSLVRITDHRVSRYGGSLGMSGEDAVQEVFAKIAVLLAKERKAGAQEFLDPRIGYFVQAAKYLVLVVARSWAHRTIVPSGDMVVGSESETFASQVLCFEADPEEICIDGIMSGVDRAIAADVVGQLLDGMTDAQRQLAKTFLDGWRQGADRLTYEKIGEIMGMKSNAVKQLMHRLKINAEKIRSERKLRLPNSVLELCEEAPALPKAGSRGRVPAQYKRPAEQRVEDVEEAHLQALIEDVATTGSRGSFWALAAFYRPSLLRAAMWWVGSREGYLRLSAEDAVDLGILKVSDRLERCKSKGEPYPPLQQSYFKSAIRSVFADAYRSGYVRLQQLKPDPGLVASSTGAEDESERLKHIASAESVALAGLERAKNQATITAIFAELSRAQVELAQVLYKTGWQVGEDLAKVAEILGSTPDAVKARIYRMRQRVQRICEERGITMPWMINRDEDTE